MYIKKYLLTTGLTAGLLLSVHGLSAEASSNTYTVQSGDTLWAISQRNNVSVSNLMDWNHLSSSTIGIGQELFVSSPQEGTTTYTVKAGDSLSLIARNHGTTITAIKELNGLTSDTIYIGQTLKVSSSVSVAPTENTGNYTVKSGDSLSVIARDNGTTVTAIKQLNGLSSDMIYVGQTLKLPTNSVSQPEPTAPVTVPDTYTVKAGDSLSAIAKRYGLTVDFIKKTNGLTSDTIYVGQNLKLKSNGSVQTPTPAINIVESLISEGKKYMGVPYVWGGTSPSGFDCSGFLHYVYLQNGVSIPRTVETIWAAGKSVSAPSRGDMVFFTTYKAGPSHAGIYLGDGKFLHSSSSTGVTISDMNNSYWSPRYLGAKRLH